MKKYVLPFLALVVLASCSAPKYAYHFDTYDYNAGKKQKVTNEIAPIEEAPIAVDEKTLVASTAEVILLPEVTASITKDVTTTYASLSKAEKREVKKEVIKEVKEYVKAVKAGDNEKAKEMAKAMDSNLRWAAIFGVIGIALLIIPDLGWIGGIAIIIAAVFLVMYLVNK